MEFGAPSEQILSEGDKLIKDLVQKQSCSNIELKSQLEQSKDFERSNELVTITNYTSGQLDCATFKKCAAFVNNLEELKSFGLTSDEIEIYSEFHQNGVEYICNKRKLVSKHILKDTLDSIVQKINDATEKRDQNPECGPPVSRHLKDLALSVKPESLETKLYSFALSCSASKPSHLRLDDPINRLPQLEQELFGARTSCGVPNLKKRRKRARKYLDKAPAGVEPIFDYKHDKKSKWDVQTATTTTVSEPKIYSCAKPVNYYTIKDNKIVKLQQHET